MCERITFFISLSAVGRDSRHFQRLLLLCHTCVHTDVWDGDEGHGVSVHLTPAGRDFYFLSRCPAEVTQVLSPHPEFGNKPDIVAVYQHANGSGLLEAEHFEKFPLSPSSLGRFNLE